MSIVNTLEITCSQCSGTGKDGSKKCKTCKGAGGFLTAEGLQFMRFLERHYKPTALAQPKAKDKEFK